MPHHHDESVSLREYVDQRFADQQMAVNAALAAAEKASDKADAANERRFESVNEFRATLKDQQGTFVTRTELFAWIGVAAAIGALAGHFWK